MSISSSIKLLADPTFRTRVAIPVAGSSPADVMFTFQHKTRDQLQDFLSKIEKRKPEDVIAEIVTDWNIDGAKPTKESVKKFLQNYHGAGPAILKGYIDELLGVRRPAEEG